MEYCIQKNKMFSSINNDIINFNFHYHNAKNKNILFAIKIFKDKKVFNFEKEVRKKLELINYNDFLYQIYSEEKSI